MAYYKKGSIPWNKGRKGGGWKLSEKTRQKMRERMKGNKFSLDKKHTENTKRKMSEAHKKNPTKYWLGKKGELNPNWKGGHKYNWLESKEKLLKNKEKLAGRKRPEECEICGSVGRIFFDHNHKTGKFRGWICVRCNTAIGMAKDNSELLMAMADYLKKSNEFK